MSGLDHSEPDWFWAKENPPPVKEAGFGKLIRLKTTCGGAGSGADC